MFIFNNATLACKPDDRDAAKEFKKIPTFSVEIGANNYVRFFNEDVSDEDFFEIAEPEEITVDRTYQYIHIRYEESGGDHMLTVRLEEPAPKLKYLRIKDEMVDQAESRSWASFQADKIIQYFKEELEGYPEYYERSVELSRKTADFRFSVIHVSSHPNRTNCKYWYCIAICEGLKTDDYYMETCWSWDEVHQFIVQYLMREDC